MNTKFLTKITCGWALVLLFSCSLNEEPTDSISPGNAFRNLDDIELGLYGAYAALGTSLMESATIVGDEVRMPGENTVSNTDAHRWLYDSGSGSVTTAFYSFYQAIDRANRVLENLDQIENPSEEKLKNQYKGELLGIRAFAHFELLRGYASGYTPEDLGVPYMLISEVGYPARDPVGSNYQAIGEDLAQAKELLPESFTQVTRMTRVAVAALQARLALYQKKWQDAVDYATEAITQNPLASRSDFPLIWKDESDAEVLWKLSRITGDPEYGNLFFRQSGGIALYVPSFKLLKTFENQEQTDIRFQAYIDAQPDRNAMDAKKSNYLVRKYEGNDPSAPGLTDIKLLRTGELYLIRAEAYAELNKIDKGVADLNTLRAARIQGYTPAALTDKSSLIEAVYTERFKELAFEGQRFFDLKRRNLKVERWEEDLINTSQKEVLSPEDAQYNFPIPADERAVNEHMEQNPNY